MRKKEERRGEQRRRTGEVESVDMYLKNKIKSLKKGNNRHKRRGQGKKRNKNPVKFYFYEALDRSLKMRRNKIKMYLLGGK